MTIKGFVLNRGTVVKKTRLAVSQYGVSFHTNRKCAEMDCTDFEPDLGMQVVEATLIVEEPKKGKR